MNLKRIFVDRGGEFEKCTSRFLLNMRLVLQKSLLKHDRDADMNFTESDCNREFGSGQEVGDIMRAEALDNMETHMADVSMDKHIGYIVHCLLILEMLESVDFLNSKVEPDLYNKVGYQLFHNQGAILMNSHYIYATTVSKSFKDRNEQYVQGSSLYPVLPLLNHSCKANTLRYVCVYVSYEFLQVHPSH